VDLQAIREAAGTIRREVEKVVVGQREAVDLLLVALLAEGHALLEGLPGTAKTLLARAFARCLSLRFTRIQFTPDLMPGDVTGTNLFDFQKSEFVLTRGPLFTEVLLADEINRTPPKTQAALLEAMQERTVTIDGTSYPLGPGFMVVATQNPIEQEGTYPLPEAQLDRFLVKIEIAYPERELERQMVQTHGRLSSMPDLERFGLEAVVGLEFLTEARAQVAALLVSDEILDYVVDLVRATREHPSLLAGASPRATNMLAASARAAAILAGRDYVIPDDVKRLAVQVLAHRVVLAPSAELEAATGARIVRQILEELPAPK